MKGFFRFIALTAASALLIAVLSVEYMPVLAEEKGYIRLTSGSVALREKAGTAYRKLATLSRNTVIPWYSKTTEKVNGYYWYECEYNGIRGYVAADYVTPANPPGPTAVPRPTASPAATATPGKSAAPKVTTTPKATEKPMGKYLKVTAGSLTMREHAGTAYKKLAAISRGTVIPWYTKTAKKVNGYYWYECEYSGIRGYVAADYVAELNDPLPSVTPSVTPKPAVSPTAAPRKTPTVIPTVTQKITATPSVTPTKTPDPTAVPEPTRAPSEQHLKLTASNVALRENAGTAYKKRTTLNKGTVIPWYTKTAERINGYYWYECEYNGLRGYVAADFVVELNGPPSAAPSATPKPVSTPAATPRRTPTTVPTVPPKVTATPSVTPTKTPDPTAAPEPTQAPSEQYLKLTASNVALRESAGTAYKKRTTLNKGTVIPWYTKTAERINGYYWYECEYNGLRGYVAADFVTPVSVPGNTAAPTPAPTSAPESTVPPRLTPVPSAAPTSAPDSGNLYVKATARLNYRLTPEGNILGVVNAGTRLPLLGYDATGEWCFVYSDAYGFGYISASYAAVEAEKDPSATPFPIPTVRPTPPPAVIPDPSPTPDAEESGKETGGISVTLRDTGITLRGNGIIRLPSSYEKGTAFELELTCPSAWTVEMADTPGTVSWLEYTGSPSGTGDSLLRFTVTATPGSERMIRNRDNYATSVTIRDGEGNSLAFCIAVYKASQFTNDHINTGNYTEDLIAVALTQLGYEGSNKRDDYDGIVNKGNTHGDCTKYAKYMDINGNPWCASFISWCAFQAGIPTSALNPTTYARPGEFSRGVRNGSIPVHYLNGLNETQRKANPFIERYGIKTERDQCAPKRGDLIFFRDEKERSSVAFSHVGLVLEYRDGVITYIDGNGSGTDLVALRTVWHDDPYIAAYFSPW